MATERDFAEVAREVDDKRRTDALDVEEVVETASAVSKVHLIVLFSLPTFLLLTPSLQEGLVAELVSSWPRKLKNDRKVLAPRTTNLFEKGTGELLCDSD